jgi:probable phosphoglycerate mutase
MAKLILIRHGEIAANREHLWHGSTNSPLTSLGEAQAKRLGERISTDYPNLKHIYSSPLDRAHNTAKAIQAQTQAKLDIKQKLAEYSIGELEGSSYQTLAHELKFFERIHKDPDYAPPEGESFKAVQMRVTHALKQIARLHQGEDIAVVSHGAVTCLGIACLVHNDPLEWKKYFIKNTSVSELRVTFSDKEPDTHQAELIKFNCIKHLDGLES